MCYQGRLEHLAHVLNRDDEYKWFVERLHCSIHSSAFALIHGPSLKDGRTILGIASWIVARVAKLLIHNDRLSVSDEAMQLVQAYDDYDLLNMR